MGFSCIHCQALFVSKSKVSQLDGCVHLIVMRS
jgi:hypothetical protein